MYPRMETRKGISYKLHRLSRAVTKSAQAIKAVDVLARHMDICSEADLMEGAQRNLRETIAWLTYCNAYLDWLQSSDWPEAKKPVEPTWAIWNLT